MPSFAPGNGKAARGEGLVPVSAKPLNSSLEGSSAGDWGQAVSDFRTSVALGVAGRVGDGG